MQLLYNIFIHLFWLLAKLIALFHSKTRRFVEGRKSWRSKLKSAMKDLDQPVWVHCSSLGEFEQGRPVIEALKKKGETIVLSFFSPSGYEHVKNSDIAEVITYLPIDTPKNAKDFVQLVNPKMAIFIKYEFWFNHISVTHLKQIPIYLVSGIFRESHYFFKFYGQWFARQLNQFTYFFVQNKLSEKLLRSLGIEQVKISGDTRFDRVLAISKNRKALDVIESFKNNEPLIVAGSTWEPDEKFIGRFVNEGGYKGKIVLAPHQVDASRLQQIESLFKGNTIRFSNYKNDDHSKNILLLDRIGILSSTYAYGDLAIIGGGFGSGIHNTLEAAVYGLPILFGPNYKNFSEANQMVTMGTALPFNNYEAFVTAAQGILESTSLKQDLGAKNKAFVIEMAGATDIVMSELEKLL